MNWMNCERPLVITGPTGWIGNAFLAHLEEQRLRGSQRSVRLFGSSERDVLAPGGTVYPMRPLERIGADDVEGADVVHLAYLTKEKVESLGERAFFDVNTAIDHALMHAMGLARPHAVFIASSGAATLAAEGTDRHLYGIAKLLQEDRFLGYARRSGVPVMAARIFNIAGPYINKRHSYAISSFIDQAFATGRIRIDATWPVYRSYLHVGDLADLALQALERGIGSPLAIDFCGSEVVEMSDIARAVARLAGLPDTVIDRAPLDFGRSSAYLGNPVEVRSIALRCGSLLRNFQAQLEDTATFLTV